MQESDDTSMRQMRLPLGLAHAMMAFTLTEKIPMQPSHQEVEKAEKKVAGVLEDLEHDTKSDVKKIQLEDVVDTDKDTGKPSVQKGVDITVSPKVDRKWSR